MDNNKYNDDGMRLTDCCGCVSTFSDDTLCCKGCWKAVPHGQGDGLEYRRSSTCVTCGTPTNLGDTCEECCARDCDRCGKLIDFDTDIWVTTTDNEDLNIHDWCKQSSDKVAGLSHTNR